MTATEFVRATLTPPAEVTSPKALLEWARREGVQEVDVKFTDIRGLWQHFSIPLVNFDASIFSEGIGFDGSSIRGFQDIHESDMNLFPDPGHGVHRSRAGSPHVEPGVQCVRCERRAL